MMYYMNQPSSDIESMPVAEFLFYLKGMWDRKKKEVDTKNTNG